MEIDRLLVFTYSLTLNCAKFRRFLTIRRIIEFVQPICLPFEDDANENYKDSKFIVAGWGYTIADIEWKYNSTYSSDSKILNHNIHCRVALQPYGFHL